MKHARMAPVFERCELSRAYDVIVIGAGIHGLAAGYYLASRHGMRKVAIVDKGYPGGGNSGRNTAIIRSNYRTPEGIRFYDASMRLWETLEQELDWPVDVMQCGHLTLAHTESAVHGLRIREHANRVLGVDSRIIEPAEIARLVPALDLSDRPELPVLSALYHPPGGIVDHDEVAYGYAAGCRRCGVEVHPFTEVQSLEPQADGTIEVGTTRGKASAGAVLNATAGWATTISQMIGVVLPIVTHPLQACVTELVKPFLDKVLVSASLHVYVNQTAKGELVLGAEIDPYQSYSYRGTLPTLEHIARHVLELLPQLHGVRILRQWAGICDMTPDYAPIMGRATGVPNYYMDVGWGTWGFKASPICGFTMAQTIANGCEPELIRPFSLDRFTTGQLLGEKAAAAVSS
jgi:sarcosine oxidase, subunit beta